MSNRCERTIWMQSPSAMRARARRTRSSYAAAVMFVRIVRSTGSAAAQSSGAAGNSAATGSREEPPRPHQDEGAAPNPAAARATSEQKGTAEASELRNGEHGRLKIAHAPPLDGLARDHPRNDPRHSSLPGSRK